ncbi:hypothetical protein C1H76_5526 [Elsinoe australis]|uniref:Uncharacterized protein n=1 Tax=Elsinoe australis TaxID=40998 RepID=A0A4U7B0K2_9PEZI|nr:hypothetical protein C1H76_5526 [Elsinoe australis]
MLESPNERERMVSQSFGPGGSTYFIPSSKGGDSRQIIANKRAFHPILTTIGTNLQAVAGHRNESSQ